MEVWESVARELCSMTALLWLAIKDKKQMEIKRMALFVTSAMLLLAGFFGTTRILERLGGAAFGVIMLLFCYFSKEAMGYADGIVICVCGIAFGLWKTLMMCFFGALYAGLFSAVLLVSHRAGRKSRIPFLPFLLLGYVTVVLLVHTA